MLFERRRSKRDLRTLNTPINYFFPKEFTDRPCVVELTCLEQELISHTRKLSQDDLHSLIAHARALTELK
jgi:hypothetical protein